MPNTAKLITYYEAKSQEEMEETRTKTCRIWVDGSTGVDENPNVTWFGTSKGDYLTAGQNWEIAFKKGLTGTNLQKEAATALMLIFAQKAKGMAEQANAQCGGNVEKLKSTGLTMAENNATVGVMDKAVIKSITQVDGVDGMFEVDIETSKKSCHGSIVRIINLVDTTVREFQVHDKSRLTVTDCKPGIHYSMQVAYDGTDPLRVWSDPKPFWGQ